MAVGKTDELIGAESEGVLELVVAFIGLVDCALVALAGVVEEDEGAGEISEDEEETCEDDEEDILGDVVEESNLSDTLESPSIFNFFLLKSVSFSLSSRFIPSFSPSPTVAA